MIEMYGTITNKSYAFQVISFVTISSAFFHKLPTSQINRLNRQNNGGNQIRRIFDLAQDLLFEILAA